MKNDITYEYRVFTNRLVDIEPMEVGICTSKVLKGLKQKDKVDGRFFHTSDADEWYFCWNGQLQKLNLKGNSDVNAALEKAEQLIAKANTAVESAKEAAADATAAADAATAAVESIDNKADKSDVENVVKVVETKAEQSDVNALTNRVNEIEGEFATKEFVNEQIKNIVIPEVPSTDDFATKDSVEALTKRVDAIVIPSTDNFATKDSVEALTKRVDAIVIPSDYYTKTEIDNLIGVAVDKTNTILND
jgi:hypothetical protein